MWTADVVAGALKALSDRPRPYETLADVDPLLGGALGTSLPSGHAATSFAGAVLLTGLVRRGAPAFFALATAIAFSRVYVGVHYPLDVVAGAALGALVGAAAAAAVARRRPTPLRRTSVDLPRSAAPPPPG